ncbi:MAG: hypothetical protein JWM04_1622, partial [Verrucomicrobiales bacterium]|nr:hypothetical protein [Verrucomicrobiales bacterium]
AKCECPHFQEDPAKPMKCKMCGQSAEEHKAVTPGAGEKQEHQH